MKKFILATALLIGSAGVAIADNGAGLVGNTVVLKNDVGDISKVYYSSAKSIEVQGPDGHLTQGEWRLLGDKICTTLGDTPENCTAPIRQPAIVGSSGTLKDADEKFIEWTVVAGKGY
ncbi:MAG: hypothetical protein KUG59_01460 [Parvibaculaceae bacterium]|nr:hypothetical protein [Parvibaculaceae bacterium]